MWLKMIIEWEYIGSVLEIWYIVTIYEVIDLS